jgi:hypothetical protein
MGVSVHIGLTQREAKGSRTGSDDLFGHLQGGVDISGTISKLH